MGPANEVSRRAFLRTLGAAVVATPVLASCALPPIASRPGQGGDRSARDQYLNFALYPNYIDGAPDGPFPTLDRFMRQSGIQVELSQDITNVRSYMDALRSRFEVGMPPATDLLIMPDEMVYPFARAGWLQTYDPDRTIEIRARMARILRNAPVDRMRKRSIPWTAGATAIAYDGAVLPNGVTDINQLLTDPRLAGRVGVFSDVLASVPTLSVGFGTKPEEMATGAVKRTIAAVAQAARAGQFAKVYDSITYVDAFRSGEVIAGLAYSGDILNARQDIPTLGFTIPTGGAQLWADSLVVPAGAPHRSNAEALLDFYYDPVNAAELAAALKFMCPVPSAKAEMAKTHPELAASRLIFPTSADLAELSMLRVIKTPELAEWTDLWNEAIREVPR